MKRSEAIKIIEECLRHPYDYPAVTILMKLEDAGMVPPMIKEKSFKILNDGQLTYAVHEWEDEKIT
jgi:hypothetical protein